MGEIKPFKKHVEYGTWCLQRDDTNLTLVSVSLYDSLDDTGGENIRKDTAGSLDRGNTDTFH